MKNMVKKVCLSLLTACLLTSCSLFNREPKAQHLSTPEDLLKIAEGGNFELDNDIDCNGASLMSIRVKDETKLSIDGKGHKITNFQIISDYNCLGFIGYSDYSITFKNIAIEANITEENYEADNTKNAGILVGLCNSEVVLDNVSIKGVNNGHSGGAIESNFGGAVGVARNIDFNNVYCDVDINVRLSGNNDAELLGDGHHTCFVGGLVGQVGQYFTIKNIINTPTIDVKHFDGRGGGDVKIGYLSAECTYSNTNNVISAGDKIMGPEQGYHLKAIPGALASQHTVARTYYLTGMKEGGLESNLPWPAKSNYTPIHMTRHDILTSEVMFNEYTNDFNGEEQRMFCQFDQSIWYANAMSDAETSVGLVAFRG